ncbi:BamA/TamA family outer membrane protein [Pontibacter silvestris]|uniref:BamA/TamA family outer membrane protein n=1 Tax=Pontibacter silvestris TaxID=2305183 RepID=A0ABW4X1F4_9BACT|nr:BamA/TamA family outer membrane protein [Pontibacter silvestris]MCC9138883.1 outer membrane protein assembly factor [Pontibacter silvestris]
MFFIDSVTWRNFSLLFFIYTLCTSATSCFAQDLTFGDSITVAIAPEYDEVSKIHRFFFGENYRKIWAAPVKLKVFYLQQEKGGLSIVKQGGGMQTRSLRLADSTGNEWVLRSVEKYPERALPENMKAPVAKDVLTDLISTAHPYAQLAVPPLAEALHIPHTKPQIVYVPDDPALGKYRDNFANSVALFEQHGPVEEDTDNTFKVLDKLEEDNDNTVDQRLLLRARLLDLVIGDWDRHEDQWRWQQIEEENGDDHYYPIPRDRDQVFYNPSGLFPSIASRKWLMPKFQGFHEEIRDVKGFMFNARFFDRLFLYQLNEQDWREEINVVQSTLTDKLLMDAVKRLPDTVYALSGKEIVRKLIARRNSLTEEGLKYYRFLAKAVDIPASDKHERFEVKYGEGGLVTLTVIKIKKDGSRDKVLFQRIFHPDVTEEVRLYGRGGKDVFAVYGNNKSPIKVRMIGGGNTDTFNVADNFKNKDQLYVYDRSDKDNVFPSRSKAKLRISDDTLVNYYNPRSFAYDKLVPMATVGYNLDDGVLLGVGFNYTTHGFRKEPFAARHKLLVGHALATNAFFGRYSGYFTQLLGKYDVSLNVDARAPRNTINFFGVGNNTEYIKQGDNPIRFYRSRYSFINAEALLNSNAGKNIKLFAGFAGQFYYNRQSENTGRFITIYNEQNPQENVFSSKVYAGLVTGFEFDTRNNPILPAHGVYWNTSVRAMQQLNGQKSTYGQVQSQISFYLNPKNDTSFVVANRIGGGTTVGDPDFYQMLYLGGNENLRGFRNYRFAGESMLYHNIELRLKLFDFTTYLFPGSLGLIGFNDIGRVWTEGESSGKWHDGFGGGFYLVPAQLILIQGVIGFSGEETLPYLSVGLRF